MKVHLYPLFISLGIVLYAASAHAQGWVRTEPDAPEADDDEETQVEEVSADNQEEDDGELGFEMIGYFEKRIFPSYVISSSTIPTELSEENEDELILGDPDGNIGVFLRNVAGGSSFKVEIAAEPYIKPTVFEGKVPEGITSVTVLPKLKYDFDLLRKVTQEVPTNVSAKVTVDEQTLPEQVQVFRVQSVNEVVYAYMDYENKPVDISYQFAGFVNENHPLIDQLLKESLEGGIVPAFLGYQADDPDVVYAQAFAIWNALQRRGIRYSDITTTSTESDTVFSQHVRFLEQSVDNKQANCVDGSVLFASALRKIGIRTFLVLVPGHMFVGFYLDPEGEKAVGIETTMLGETNLGKFDTIELSAKKIETLKNTKSFEAFNAAVQTGIKALKENKAKFSDDSQLQYEIIDIAEARRMGVTPISYQK